MKYLETQKKAPGVTGDAGGVGALLGMLRSHCRCSYRNSCWQGIILALDRETLVWP